MALFKRFEFGSVCAILVSNRIPCVDHRRRTFRSSAQRAPAAGVPAPPPSPGAGTSDSLELVWATSPTAKYYVCDAQAPLHTGTQAPPSQIKSWVAICVKWEAIFFLLSHPKYSVPLKSHSWICDRISPVCFLFQITLSGQKRRTMGVRISFNDTCKV